MKKLILLFLLLTCSVSAQTVYINTGTYTGDGSNARGISGLGFQPDAVIIIGSNGTSWIWKTSSMTAGDNSLPLALTSNYVTDRIESLNADGFTIGTNADVNTNLQAYYYLAVKETAGYIDVGTYTGTGVDDRSITGVGFQAGFVLIQTSNNSLQGCWRVSGVTGDSSFLMAASSQSYQNEIQALQADGFQLGTYGQVNAVDKTYHYLAIKDMAGYTKSGHFKGDGNANRSITTPGFTGTWVWMRNFTSLATGGRVCAAEVGCASGTAFTSDCGSIGTELVDIVTNGFKVSSATGQYLNVLNERTVFWYLLEGTITFSSRKNVIVIN